MIEENGHKRRLTTTEMLTYLAISIVLNSFANGLAVATNLGSAVWTASAVNLHGILPGSLGTILFVYAIVVQLINVVISWQINWRSVVSNLLFAFLFSYLVQFWTHILVKLQVPQFNVGIRLVLDIVGICGIALATSIYQRVDVMLHPNDEFSYLIRFKFMHGSAAWGQYLSYIIPVVIIIYCFWKTHHLAAVNIGTFFALFCQGPIIGWADQYIFHKLKHRLFLKKSAPTN
ncbi:hypothetical protein DS832_03355 [Bombilactobacillus bombi]|uniref:Sugar specific permease n=1 Tax=Bombilactobacillus bombi TaxID=1303590 RepID=A0A3R6ZVQ6_9LACO|nr:hypothetical protein [Bombilactobacillus bombi]RHW47810.1 hypothetical protein DS832_03355 [Bombilactobacillus bombi]